MFIKRFNLATLWISVGVWLGGIIIRLATLGVFTHEGYLIKLLRTSSKHPEQFVGGIAGWGALVIGGTFLVMLLTEKKRDREKQAIATERLANIM